MQNDLSQKCKTVFYVAFVFSAYFIIVNIILQEHLVLAACCLITMLIAGVLTFGKYKNYVVQKYAVGILLEICLTVYGYENGILAYNQGSFLAIVCLCSIHLDKKLNFVLGLYIIVMYAICIVVIPHELYSNVEEFRYLLMRIITIFIGQAMTIVLIKHIEAQRRLNTAKTLNRITLLRIVEEKRNEALAANNAKSDFLANMSHEIRTPMNAIVGLTEIIMRGNISPEVREHMAYIKNSSRSLVGIINEILDFSKIESGKFEIIPFNYQIASTIFDVATVGMLNTEGRPIEFTVNVDKNLPVQLLGDETRIRQIMLNFVTNATKYTKSGKIELKVHAEPQEESKILLHITVTDTGIGIKQSDMDRLFSSFMQVDTKKNRLVEGTGLGLAICKRLTELMKGTITVYSEYGEGSVFSVSIPQTVIDVAPIGEFTQMRRGDMEKASESKFTAPRAKILVVDDNRVNIMVAKGIMARYAMSIDSASSAEECFSLVHQNDYHMILMDHMMPVMDGLEATKLLRESGVKTPIIALTANAISGAKDIYMMSGFDAYISKPIEVKELERVLLDFLPPELVVREMQHPRYAASQSVTLTSSSLDAQAGLSGGLQLRPRSQSADAATAGAHSTLATHQLFSERIARTIQAEGRKKLPLIKQYWEAKDWHNYAIEVHALKTTARYCGHDGLYALAKEQQDIELSGWANVQESDFMRLYTLYEELLRSVAAEMDAGTAGLAASASSASASAASAASAAAVEEGGFETPVTYVERPSKPHKHAVSDAFRTLLHNACARNLEGLQDQVEHLSSLSLAYDQEAALWRIIAAMQLEDFAMVQVESEKVLAVLERR